MRAAAAVGRANYLRGIRQHERCRQSSALQVDWALSHARRGWYVLPLHSMRNGCCSCNKEDCASPAKHPRTRHGEKDASIDPNQIRQWWDRWPDANIGIATGPSGLVVLDNDGEEGLALFKQLALDRTETLLAKTGRPKGFHIYYLGTGIPSSQVKGEHLDVRGATGYVVAPGSVHENGTVYVFLNPDCAPIAVPDWVAAWVASRSGKTASSVNDDPLGLGPIPEYLKSRRQTRFGASFENAQPPYSPQEAARLRSALAKIPANLDGKTWFSFGAAMHDLHWIIDGQDIGFEIFDEWSKRSTGKGPGNGEYRGRADLEKRWLRFGSDYKGPRTTIASIYRMAKQFGWIDETLAKTKSEDFHTDLGNAKRLVARHGENIRFIHGWQKWIVWSDHQWQIDNDGAVIRLAKGTVMAMYSEAIEIQDERRRQELIRHALKSQAEPRLQAMISLAESEIHVVLSPKQLDADPFLLGVKNGVVELKTGTFRPGRREDFITRQAGVCYDPHGMCPAWLNFLVTVTGGNIDLQNYLQRAIGYALTGLVREEVAFVLHGIGSNGKSTFRETLHALFGEYALAADAGLLTERRNPGGASEEIARLKGCRFVAVNETNENDQLHEARLKFITSQDTITARNLYGHFFDFFPSHKTFVTTNHKPIVRGTDEGIWRRLHLLPFTVSIPKEAVKKDFRERWLMPELAGILNFAIAGALAYFKDGLNPPAMVRAATEDYRQDMDVVGQWIEERCERGSHMSVPSSVAYWDYTNLEQRLRLAGP